MSDTQRSPLRSVAHFLLMSRDIRDLYPTPEDAADALLQRLKHDGFQIVPLAASGGDLP